MGIRCKDGVVLALEKLVTSKLLKPNANKRIATVDRNMGIVRGHETGHGKCKLTVAAGLLRSSPRRSPLRLKSPR